MVKSIMSLVRRQSHEELESRTRHHSRRAMKAFAACAGSLLGMSALASGLLAHEINKAQHAVEEYVMPPDHDKVIFVPVSQRQNETQDQSQPPITLHLQPEQHAAADPHVDWEWPAGAVGGATVVSFATLVGLGIWQRRRNPNPSQETDVETLQEYGNFSFEITNLQAAESIHGSGEGSTQYYQEFCQRVRAADTAAGVAVATERAASPLNLAHMRARGAAGLNPLAAFNYACPEVYNEHLDSGSSVADACRPLNPAWQ